MNQLPLDRLRSMIKTSYSPEDITKIEQHLVAHHTFDFPLLRTGLYSAAAVDSHSAYTGYQNVWVRDNIHIAHARYRTGHSDEAVRAVLTLMRYFIKHRGRFYNVISGSVDKDDPMERPHIRFNGETLEELPDKWAHAQNDALGYFLWLYSLMVTRGDILPDKDAMLQLGLFSLYLSKTEYWQDRDSGHWEEHRKVSASSIGTVVAGLLRMRELLAASDTGSISFDHHVVDLQMINELIRNGIQALDSILPWECREPTHERRYDAALLFLIYPLCLVSGYAADEILRGTCEHLVGEYGIRRYPGDSFWCANYKQLLTESQRTADFSDNISARDRLLHPGEEAQWCIFDSMISAIYGIRYRDTGSEVELERQIYHFNRAVQQVTEKYSPSQMLACPELYYVEQGRYMPNDVAPLLWAQANLSLAIWHMKESLM